MAKPTKLAHVVYQTRRFDEMLDWYQRVFEAKVVYQNPAVAFLTYDDEHHRFALVNMTVFSPLVPTTTGTADTGLNHVGYTFADLGELLDNYERLKFSGIEPYWRVHHGVTLSLYYRDPDGNRMEFQVDTCTVEEANAFMLSDAFATNPIGVEIDPDILLAAYRSGTSTDQLLKMPLGPPAGIPAEHGLN